MEEIKQQLFQLFDEMMLQVKSFKHRTYDDIFQKCFDKYKDTFEAIDALYMETPDEEHKALIEELALAIPDYVLEQTKVLPKNKRERLFVDYNMNMAVYVVPAIAYNRRESCEQISKRMVELWNEKKVTNLQLGASSYDEIAGGFKKGLCFITTAVCEHQNKPDDCYELTVLRAYRDGYMMHKEEGRMLVEEYYDTAPALVQILNMQKDSEAIYEELYRDYILPCIADIEAGENEHCQRQYTHMVRHLQKTYFYS